MKTNLGRECFLLRYENPVTRVPLRIPDTRWETNKKTSKRIRPQRTEEESFNYQVIIDGEKPKNSSGLPLNHIYFHNKAFNITCISKFKKFQVCSKRQCFYKVNQNKS